MADGISMQINGLDALVPKLRAFSGNAARRIYTAASRKALKETHKKAKANAQALDDPKTAENIAKNVQTKVNGKRFLSHGLIYARVGVVGGAIKGKGGGGKGGDTYYWRFLEHGWIPPNKNAQGKSVRRSKKDTLRLIEMGTSKVPARPFLRPAMDMAQITDAYANALSAAIEKEMKRMGGG